MNRVQRLHILSPEPDPGSVVMTYGLAGTAWQRLHVDGLWHSATGEVSDWQGILLQRNIFLIIDTKTLSKRERDRG